MAWFRRLLFGVARSPVSAFFIGFAFEHLAALLPVNQVSENAQVLVFQHPVPFWQFHMLGVPKKRLRSLASLALGTPAGQTLLLALLAALRAAAQAKCPAGYKIIVNGGRYQDVPQLHFHLCSGQAANGDGNLPMREDILLPGAPLAAHGAARLYAHPQPSRAVHYLLAAGADLPPFGRLDFAQPAQAAALCDLFVLAQASVAQLGLEAYTLIIDVPAGQPGEALVLHLVSGAAIQP